MLKVLNTLEKIMPFFVPIRAKNDPHYEKEKHTTIKVKVYEEGCTFRLSTGKN